MKNATWKDLLGLKEVRNFLTGAVLVVSAIIFVITCIIYLLHNDFLEREYTVYTRYEDGTGMSRGAKVLLNGVQIGSVQGVSLNSDAQVVLALNLQLKYQTLIRRNSIAYYKRDRNMVSDRALNIEKGDPHDPMLRAGDTLLLAPPQDIETTLGSLASLTTQFRLTLMRVDSLLHLVTDTHTTIGALLVKDDIYRKTLKTVESIDRVAVRGDQTIQRIDQLGAGLEKSLPRILEHADSLSTSLRRTANNADTMGQVGLHLLRRGESIAGQIETTTGNGNNLINRSQIMLDGVQKHWLLGKIVNNPKNSSPSKPSKEADSAK